MTSSWFVPAFVVFLLFGLYIWTIGAAVFGRSHGIEDLFRLPWLGYGVLLGALQIAHIFFPIDRRFSAGFLFLTAALTLSANFWRGPQRSTLNDVARHWPKLLLLGAVALLIFLPIFNTCTKPACYYDVGLYYLQKIRWLETFPLVPGLGNLLLNLGYNQSAFLVTALLDGLLPDRLGLWLVGGLLPWLGLTLSAYALIRVLSARRAQRSPLEGGVAYFWMLLCAPLLLHTIFWISTAPEPRYFGTTPWLFAIAPSLGLIAAQRSIAFMSVLTNLYLCAVPMAGLMVSTAWAWATPEAKFPEIPRPRMTEHANTSGLLYYAPIEGNQSFDHPLPSSSDKLHGIELLNPVVGIAGGFRGTHGKKGIP